MERKKRTTKKDYSHGGDVITVVHPFPPFYQKDSQILILGSFPSIKSRAENFFYAHPQNRFWKILAAIFQEEVPETKEAKKVFLKKHKIALWDVIYSCKIKGSSDSSIQDVIPNNLEEIIRNAPITKIICNGSTSHKYYTKYQGKQFSTEAVLLPSTSPANAAYSLEKLVYFWSQELFL